MSSDAQRQGRLVLVTGGAGGVGAYVCRRFAADGWRVRVFDLPTPINRRVFAPGEANIETVWGDITNPRDMESAMKGVSDVFHLAAVLPPATDANPGLARKVNVEGTRTVARAAADESARAGRPVSLKYSSSVTVYGITAHLTPPLPADQPVNPSCVYSETKAAAEEVVRESRLPWTVMRFAAAVYLTIRKGGFQQMRIIPPENRIEFVHIHDVAEAFINSMDNPEALGKNFVLGGGPLCRMLYRDQIKKTFDLLGFPEPDWSKFSKQPFNLDWYDTTESQRVLKFQSRTFEDYLKDFKQTLGWKYTALHGAAGPLMKLFRIHV